MAELANELNIKQQHVRFHLTTLEDARLVEARKVPSRNREELVKEFSLTLDGLAAITNLEREAGRSTVVSDKGARPTDGLPRGEKALAGLLKELAAVDALRPSVEVAVARIAEALGISAGRAAEIRFETLHSQD